MAKLPVPVYILSGFLGSGKTTLLSRAVRYYQEQGLKPAIVMNELGEVNLDGAIIGLEVPMAEMLDGCVCCTIREDLGITLQQLLAEEKPDVVWIEATGVANPFEIVDGVTDAALYTEVDLRGVITVADAAHLADEAGKGMSRTLELQQEQIACASLIVLNKIDRVDEMGATAARRMIREWNPYAPIAETIRSNIEMKMLEELGGNGGELSSRTEQPEDAAPIHGQGSCCSSGHGDDGHHDGHIHHSHEHVTVYTRYLNGPVDSVRFEELIARLPEAVHRAKGVLTFSDTLSRYLFQYAYRQPDFMRIESQANIPDVVVFIGDNIPRAELEAEMDLLENGG